MSLWPRAILPAEVLSGTTETTLWPLPLELSPVISTLGLTTATRWHQITAEPGMDLEAAGLPRSLTSRLHSSVLVISCFLATCRVLMNPVSDAIGSAQLSLRSFVE